MTPRTLIPTVAVFAVFAVGCGAAPPTDERSGTGFDPATHPAVTRVEPLPGEWRLLARPGPCGIDCDWWLTVNSDGTVKVEFPNPDGTIADAYFRGYPSGVETAAALPTRPAREMLDEGCDPDEAELVIHFADGFEASLCEADGPPLVAEVNRLVQEGVLLLNERP